LQSLKEKKKKFMLVIDHQILDIEGIKEALDKKSKLVLSEDARKAILHCNQFLKEKVANSDDSFYGINTGFGSLCNVKIDKQELEELQSNLVQSHAFGTGDLVPLAVIRLMLLLKIKNLSFGFSGIREELIERLIFMYNEDCLPVIFQLGSLGASGDLAPLAHLSLALIGKGEVFLKGERMPAAQALAQLGIEPMKLQMKEGLAMLNGTQFSLAYGLHAIIQAERLSQMADMIAAMAVDAFGCVLTPFDPRLHRIRPHAGQIQTAANIRHYLRDSALAKQPKNVVQDPYSFRCVPQVHGASKDAINYVKSVFETEVNSVTDNPNIFPDTDAILSGGNFHAQPLALPLDFLAIALSELGNISERRLYQLIGGKRGLPPFLTRESGLHSGLMIGQYTAASIVSQNKQLCTPASVDSIVSCNGQEDHVSMAANAGTKLYKVVENLERILAIEFMAVAQALFLRGGQTGSDLAKVLVEYRKIVEPIGQDRVFHEDLNQTLDFLKQLEF
jgi:histidine ammonia-lyase